MRETGGRERETLTAAHADQSGEISKSYSDGAPYFSPYLPHNTQRLILSHLFISQLANLLALLAAAQIFSDIRTCAATRRVM